MGPTAAEGRYLRAEWGKVPAIELARKLKISRPTVYRWAAKLDLTHGKPAKRWSAHETGTLDGSVSTSRIQSLAHQLVRSPSAVVEKMRAENITKASRGYTAASLASALGVDAHKVAAWVKLGWLPDRRRHTSRTAEQGDLHYIAESDVWRLVTEHPLDVFPAGMTAEQWVWLAGLAPSAGRKSA